MNSEAAVQVFKWTACTCQRRSPLEPRASMYAKRPSPSRNLSNTVQNESFKEEIFFGNISSSGRNVAPPPGGTFSTVGGGQVGRASAPHAAGRNEVPSSGCDQAGRAQAPSATLQGSFLLPDISARNYTLHKHLSQVAPQVDILGFGAGDPRPMRTTGSPLYERWGVIHSWKGHTGVRFTSQPPKGTVTTALRCHKAVIS